MAETIMDTLSKWAGNAGDWLINGSGESNNRGLAQASSSGFEMLAPYVGAGVSYLAQTEATAQNKKLADQNAAFQQSLFNEQVQRADAQEDYRDATSDIWQQGFSNAKKKHSNSLAGIYYNNTGVDNTLNIGQQPSITG